MVPVADCAYETDGRRFAFETGCPVACPHAATKLRESHAMVELPAILLCILIVTVAAAALRLEERPIDLRLYPDRHH
jgi:hypothetical protein